ncbi:MAG: fibronectin type III domain-containing protein [Bdellovibrionaceae bacterium]|nr:fibronectin type III domain-containing protein [Pseudobdellovibrionaceae bacterium]
MKLFFGLLVFVGCLFFSIFYSMESLASSPEGPHNTTAAGGHGRDNTSLFPPKKPNKSLSTPPALSILLEPVTMSKVGGSAVVLKWQAVAGADSYHLQVATDANFKWLKADENLYKNTSYELKNLEAGKHYYWRVASINSGNIPSTIKSDFVKSMFEATSN